MMTLSRVYDFSSSHRLYRPEWSEEENRKRFGKCATQHGHNYRLVVGVSGPLDPGTRMILDASLLDRVVHEAVYDDVDHKDLNTHVPWLEGLIPTTEVFAEACRGRIAQLLWERHPDVRLRRIELWETRRICVVIEA